MRTNEEIKKGGSKVKNEKKEDTGTKCRISQRNYYVHIYSSMHTNNNFLL